MKGLFAILIFVLIIILIVVYIKNKTIKEDENEEESSEEEELTQGVNPLKRLKKKGEKLLPPNPFHKDKKHKEHKPPSPPSPPYSGPPMTFNVLAYNVFDFPSYIALTGQNQRLSKIPQALYNISKATPGGLDAISLSEAWDDDTRDKLAKHMTEVFGEPWYNTGVIPRRGSKALNGGVIMLTKWKLEDHDYHIYDSCSVLKEMSNADCYAAKGVMYMRVNKHNKIFNLFGTHLQSGHKGYRSKVKNRQIHELKKFIDSKGIPKNEPIIICGDFNIDMLSRENEYNDAMKYLNTTLPTIVGPKYTIDQSSSVHTHDKGKTGYNWLDYILTVNDHQQPLKATVSNQRKFVTISPCFEVRWDPGSPFIKRNPLKKTKKKCIADLSDHMPLLGEFTFSA